MRNIITNSSSAPYNYAYSDKAIRYLTTIPWSVAIALYDDRRKSDYELKDKDQILQFTKSKNSERKNTCIWDLTKMKNPYTSTFHNNSGIYNAGWAIASSKIALARSISNKDFSNSSYLLLLEYWFILHFCNVPFPKLSAKVYVNIKDHFNTII